MTMFKTLLVGAAIGAILAVGGVAAAMKWLSPTAQEVATEMAGQTQGDPLTPPDFYGSR
jgi:dsRNA-specific ribonuclease